MISEMLKSERCKIRMRLLKADATFKICIRVASSSTNNRIDSHPSQLYVFTRKILRVPESILLLEMDDDVTRVECSPIYLIPIFYRLYRYL